MSASLFVAGDPFAALGQLEVETREAPSWRAAFESPFPYASHMRAVALADVGDPVELTTAVLADLARALGGRTLGLFTSLRRMREVQERLAVALRPDGIEVWMPRRATDDPGALVDRFRRARGGGVLLGSRTFWQGIDVPGPALEAVVIEKLPFEVPTELRRRREARVRDAGGDAFELSTLGVMLLNLKQMVGRLIRSEDDRGLVVVVDPRRERPYFERISAALPPGLRLRGRDARGAARADRGARARPVSAERSCHELAASPKCCASCTRIARMRAVRARDVLRASACRSARAVWQRIAGSRRRSRPRGSSSSRSAASALAETCARGQRARASIAAASATTRSSGRSTVRVDELRRRDPKDSTCSMLDIDDDRGAAPISASQMIRRYGPSRRHRSAIIGAIVRALTASRCRPRLRRCAAR